MSPPVLDIRGLHKRFSAEHWVIDDLSLSVSEGELLCVLGSSGCGKTTMLRLISGFEVPDRGEIVHQGRLIAKPGWGVRPERRRIGMVFQNYALFPHMTVRANVRFGLEPPLGQRIAGCRAMRCSPCRRGRRAARGAAHGDDRPHPLCRALPP